MKSIASGSASSCLIWLLVFGVISMCLVPMAAFIGGFSSTLQANFVASTLSPYLCPEDSTAEVITFQTTSRNEFGTELPATGYEMQCVDVKGNIIKEPSPDYAFYWVGVLAVGSLIISGLLALLFAGPISALITRLVRRNQKTNNF